MLLRGLFRNSAATEAFAAAWVGREVGHEDNAADELANRAEAQEADAVSGAFGEEKVTVGGGGGSRWGELLRGLLCFGNGPGGEVGRGAGHVHDWYRPGRESS